MSTVKSFSVGNGDMFYIKHGTDNFTIIDSCLDEDNQDRIIEEIKNEKASKTITRFISTHPDEDHLRGLKYLDTELELLNFYCVKNNATKEIESEDFLHYRGLSQSAKVFHLYKGCTRKWMNEATDERGGAGLHILWPLLDSEHHSGELVVVAEGGSPNNISAIIEYKVGGTNFLWMGDMETDYMNKIEELIDWVEVDVLFAPHHGRDSGKIPESILAKLNPKIVVIGEAPSEHLNYYQNYNTITQNSSGDITFEVENDRIHVYSSEQNYEVDFLHNDSNAPYFIDHYVGTLVTI